MNQLRATVAFGLIAALSVAGCNQPSNETPATPVQPAPQPTAPQTPPVSYACESGQSISLQYPDSSTAQLTYKGQAYAMRLAQSASGARYVGSGLEWWTATQDGQETATLSRLGPNEDVGVAVLERCSRPSTGEGTPPGPKPLPTPAPGGILPAATPCLGPQLKLSRDGGDAGMGHRVAIVGVQNVGTQACSLTGYPAVTLLDGRGRSLTAVRTDQNPGSYLRSGQAPTPVTVAPQGKAFFDLAWTVIPNEGAGETVCPTAASVRVKVPNDTANLTLTQTFQACGGRIQVSPFRDVAEPDRQPAPAT